MALEGCEVRLVDEAGVVVPDGEVEEIQFRDPAVTPGYHNLREATAARIDADGWLYTGDLAVAIGGGQYPFRGRRDDMLDVGGEKMYAQDVDRLPLAHPGVTDVCVIARPHEVKGQVPVAFVVADERVTAESFKGYASENVPAYPHPREIHLVSSMPLSSTSASFGAARLSRCSAIPPRRAPVRSQRE